MLSFFSDNKEFLKSAASIFSGAIVGFTLAHFAQEKINEHVFDTCQLNKIVAVKELPTIKSYYCLR
jgi:hypothetical protein